MGVPYTGSYDMFGTASTLPIAGAVSQSGGDVAGVTEFTGSTLSLISASFITKFDEFHSKGANILEEINESLHYRGYPIVDCNSSSSITEIFTGPNEVDVTFKVSLMNPDASGSVEYSDIESIDFITTQSISDITIAATASTHINSTFKGWSYTPAIVSRLPLGFNKSINSLFLSLNRITSSINLTETTSTGSITYYAIFDSNLEERTYCYYPVDNRNSMCQRCNNPTTVYFNKSDFTGSLITDLTWYQDTGLSTNVDNGYYYQSGSKNPQVYEVVNGSATKHIICDGTNIYCS